MSTIGQAGNSVPKVSAASVKPAAAAPEKASEKSEKTEKTIVVKPGDTLSKLAQQYGVKMEDIHRPGGKEIENKNLIYSGETLVIGKAETKPTEKTETAKPAEKTEKTEKTETAKKLFSEVVGNQSAETPKTAKDIFTQSLEAIEAKKANNQRTAEEARKAAEEAKKAEEAKQKESTEKPAEKPVEKPAEKPEAAKSDEELKKYQARDAAEAKVMASLDELSAGIGPKLEEALKGKTSAELGASLKALSEDLAKMKALEAPASELSATAAHVVKSEVRAAEQQIGELKEKYETALAAEKKAIGELNEKLNGMMKTLNEVDKAKPKDRAKALKELYANLPKFEFDPALPPEGKKAGEQALVELKSILNRKIAEHSNESELDEVDNSYLLGRPGPKFKEHMEKAVKLLAADPQDRDALFEEFHHLREAVKDFEDPMTKEATKAVLLELEAKVK